MVHLLFDAQTSVEQRRSYKGTPLRTIEKILEIYGDPSKKEAAERLGVKSKPYWDFIPISNYTIPLLHILIGVCDDVDQYFIDLVDGHIIPVTDAEKKLREDFKTMQEQIQPLIDAVTAWRKPDEGKDRSKLLSKKKKMSNAMHDGAADASSYMTVDDVTRFQYLDNVFNSLCKVRDNKKAERKRMKEKLEAYRMERKINPLSAHNETEKHSRTHGLDCGAALEASTMARLQGRSWRILHPSTLVYETYS